MTPRLRNAVPQDVSDLDEYDIAHLHSTPDSDVVVGLTRLNQIVVWRYHLMAPYRTIMGERMLDPSSGWIEHLIVVTLSTGAGREHIFTASNDGKVTHWRLDQEQHTDAYVHDVRPSRPRYSALKHPSAMFNLRTWFGLKVPAVQCLRCALDKPSLLYAYNWVCVQPMRTVGIVSFTFGLWLAGLVVTRGVLIVLSAPVLLRRRNHMAHIAMWRRTGGSVIAPLLLLVWFYLRPVLASQC